MPVPASSINSLLVDNLMLTHDVLPPYLTVDNPGVDIEPRTPQNLTIIDGIGPYLNNQFNRKNKEIKQEIMKVKIFIFMYVYNQFNRKNKEIKQEIMKVKIFIFMYVFCLIKGGYKQEQFNDSFLKCCFSILPQDARFQVVINSVTSSVK
jgi:hypothetical protein